MGQTKTVPLHVHTFIAISGNGIMIAEDMARRLLACDIDARVEDPESRTFKPGFLELVYTERPKLLADALTIWRWGRQSRLPAGRPLGSYEIWCEWCRDPLLALGCRDPVERIAQIKAQDPRRQKMTAIFEAWWLAHADALMKAGDIDAVVIQLIDEKASRKTDGELQYNRQLVA